VREATRNMERDLKTSEHGMLRGGVSPISPARSSRQSRGMESDSPERQEQPPPRGLRRSQTNAL
jgi:hypothetical protein